MTAIAVCVDEAPGHQIVESPFTEGTGETLVNPGVACPEGTQPHAAGFFLGYQTDSVRSHAYATALVPFPGGGIFNPAIAAIGQPNGTDLDWRVSANGICAA